MDETPRHSRPRYVAWLGSGIRAPLDLLAARAVAGVGEDLPAEAWTAEEEVNPYQSLLDEIRRLREENDTLRSMKCVVCGKRVGYINHKGQLFGWSCADGDDRHEE